MTRPSDRLTVAEVLERWEREINGVGLPLEEQAEWRHSRLEQPNTKEESSPALESHRGIQNAKLGELNT